MGTRGHPQPGACGQADRRRDKDKEAQRHGLGNKKIGSFLDAVSLHRTSSQSDMWYRFMPVLTLLVVFGND